MMLQSVIMYALYLATFLIDEKLKVIPNLLAEKDRIFDAFGSKTEAQASSSGSSSGSGSPNVAGRLMLEDNYPENEDYYTMLENETKFEKSGTIRREVKRDHKNYKQTTKVVAYNNPGQKKRKSIAKSSKKSNKSAANKRKLRSKRIENHNRTGNERPLSLSNEDVIGNAKETNKRPEKRREQRNGKKAKKSYKSAANKRKLRSKRIENHNRTGNERPLSLSDEDVIGNAKETNKRPEKRRGKFNRGANNAKKPLKNVPVPKNAQKRNKTRRNIVANRKQTRS